MGDGICSPQDREHQTVEAPEELRLALTWTPQHQRPPKHLHKLRFSTFDAHPPIVLLATFLANTNNSTPANLISLTAPVKSFQQLIGQISNLFSV